MRGLGPPKSRPEQHAGGLSFAMPPGLAVPWENHPRRYLFLGSMSAFRGGSSTYE